MVPTVITYNALISASEKGMQPKQALQLYETMQRQGEVPDVITYHALIIACDNIQQPDRFLLVC